MSLSEAVERLRRPEYTGSNRCLPCTAVNLAIAVLLAAATGAAAGLPAALLVFGGSAATITLRGYLVPGTPAITERYLPSSVLRLFGKEPLADVSPGGEADLVAAGVLTAADGDVALTPGFREAWSGRIQAIDEATPEDVALAFGTESASSHADLAYVLDGSASVRWASAAALTADVAAADLLAERLASWTRCPVDRRRGLLLGLRLRLDRCPACGGATTTATDRVDPCCERPHLVAETVCTDCGAVLADAATVDDGETESVAAALLGPGKV